MNDFMLDFRSKTLNHYVEEAAEAYIDLSDTHGDAGAAAILASATQTYNRAWFTELFWQDFQLLIKGAFANGIPVDADVRASVTNLD